MKRAKKRRSVGSAPKASASDDVPISDASASVPISDVAAIVPISDVNADVPMTDVNADVPMPDVNADVPSGVSADVPSVSADLPSGVSADVPMTDVPLSDNVGANVPTHEEEDEVIAECDVYLNHLEDPDVFQGEFYMLQYPHRPVYRPNGDQGDLRRVDVENKQKLLRMTYKLDTEATQYNKSARVQRTELVLRTTACNNQNVSYCVATIHDGKFIMTPLRSFLQCRASLDEEDSEDEDIMKNVFGQTEVKMNFAKPKKHVVEAQKANWEVLTAFGMNARETECAYDHFVHPKEEEVEFKTNNAENLFVERMCGAEMASDAIDCGNSFLSKYALSRMSIGQQVEAILWEAEGAGAALSYTEIRKRLSPQTKKSLRPEALLDHLHKSCICVRNAWVLSSELLGFTDVVAKVRESLLAALDKTGFIKVDKYISVFAKIVENKDLLLDIAKTVGSIQKGSMGEDIIVYPTSSDNLAEMFPLAAEKVARSWKLRAETISNFGQVYMKSADGKLSKELMDEALLHRLRMRLEHEVRILLTVARRVDELNRSLQNRHPNNTVSEKVLKNVLAKATLKAGNIRNVWYLQHVEGRFDPYRQCIIRLFKEQASVDVDDLRQEVRKSGLDFPTDLEVRQLLSEFSVLDGDRWVFRE